MKREETTISLQSKVISLYKLRRTLVQSMDMELQKKKRRKIFARRIPHTILQAFYIPERCILLIQLVRGININPYLLLPGLLS